MIPEIKLNTKDYEEIIKQATAEYGDGYTYTTEGKEGRCLVYKDIMYIEVK